jgi:hypothetical protein
VVASRNGFVRNGSVPPRSAALVLRRAALLALAAFAVHQLRYLAGHGAGAGEALAHHGHGYLDVALPLLISFAAAGLLGSLLLSAWRRPDGDGRTPSCLRAPCFSYAAALVAIFAAQELAEGALVPSHPDGLEGTFGHGGWLALPLAVVMGAAVSIASAGISAVEERVVGLVVGSHLSAPRCIGAVRRIDLQPLARLTLPFGFARRAPPSSLPSR